jgi:hypothetical protein
VGIARVITHDILRYFLPGRQHNATGIFMEHHRGDSPLSPTLDISPDPGVAEETPLSV